MDFEEITQRVGKNLKYYSDTGGWLTGKDITQSDIEEYVNEVYQEEMFPLFARSYPWLFRHTGELNSWILTATVNASSTGTTLVIDTDSNTQFANAMVGLYVYNETDGEKAEITGYTSTSTVTLDTTIGDTWDGDTVKVLGQEFALGGDATDIYTIERVAVKYDADSTAEPMIGEVRDKQDFFVTGQEVFDRTYPYVYMTSVQDAEEGMTTAIGVLPKFEEPVTNGIKIDYLARPSALEDATDKPRFKVAASLIAGATMKCYEKRQNTEMSSYWLNKYEVAKIRDISRYRTTTTNRPRRIKPSRSAYYRFKRII